jgi:hypothetical protein
MEKGRTDRRARFCAGCHSWVLFCSSQFNDPNCDHVNGFKAKAGITCSVCRRITPVNSRRENETYTINAPTRSVRHGSASIRDVAACPGKTRLDRRGSLSLAEKGALRLAVRSRFEDRL